MKRAAWDGAKDREALSEEGIVIEPHPPEVVDVDPGILRKMASRLGYGVAQGLRDDDTYTDWLDSRWLPCSCCGRSTREEYCEDCEDSQDPQWTEANGCPKCEVTNRYHQDMDR